ncbi:Histidine triad (HIT) protein [Methylophaga frappieri]|jgi:histidine triad (HIT) family protein|uniref:Histidine triad (HIT) protein n=1 Tax=Methylophaga frappieri (strain ATCC BAA-2434 / DSM 25690 / JAM7) TaxID=754477 RepID=I1YJM6_METFJ|nr:histidine triad nucleotide-binding protein [Methylophaga frappieri]AFJ03119.1 Histidine triad (HIT) protein [Methylophaga frappieri]
MTDCLFCKIIAGEIPSSKVYEDDLIFVFKDINPKAEIHLLIIPKEHIDRLDNVSESQAPVLTAMLQKLPELAESQGLTDGFRTIINTGPAGGQEVYHLHMHLLGGKQLPGFH